MFLDLLISLLSAMSRLFDKEARYRREVNRYLDELVGTGHLHKYNPAAEMHTGVVFARPIESSPEWLQVGWDYEAGLPPRESAQLLAVNRMAIYRHAKFDVLASSKLFGPPCVIVLENGRWYIIKDRPFGLDLI